MATITEYVNTGNDGAAHVAVFGAPLAPGPGTNGSATGAWNTWAQMQARVLDVATDHSNDDLVINLHPACIFLAGAGVQTFATWSNVGKAANSWRSVTLQRWKAKIDEDSRYADWYPTIDTTQPITAWTRGRIVAGSFVVDPASGDVYRGDVFQQYATWSYGWVWGGVDRKDCRSATRPEQFTYHKDLSTMAAAGDISIGTNTPNGTSGLKYVYVKTGQDGVDPTARWGNQFVYVSPNYGQLALIVQNSRKVVWEDLQTNGGYVRLYSGATAGDSIEDCTLRNHRGRMRYSRGVEVASPSSEPTAFTLRCRIESPRLIALLPKAAIPNVAGGAQQESGTSDGVVFNGTTDSGYVSDPYVEGFSHVQVGFNPESYSDAYTVPDSTVDRFNPTPLYVWGAFDGSDFTSRRTFWIAISGTFTGTVTLQKSASLAGPWTDVKTWTAPLGGTQEMFNDGASDAVYYRIGCKQGQLSSGTPSVRLRALAYPRNCKVMATTYEDDKSTVVCAHDIPSGKIIYSRGLAAAGQRMYIGPIRVKKQVVQSQFQGDVLVNGPVYDGSNGPWGGDLVGVDNCNTDNHVAWGQNLMVFRGSDVPSGGAMVPPQVRLRGLGLRHDLRGGFAGAWLYGVTPDDSIQVRGCLIKDSGHVRYRQQTDEVTNFVTRRRTPFLSYHNSTTNAGPFALLQDNVFIRAPGTEGFIARKAPSQSDTVNASSTTYPVTQVAGTGGDPGWSSRMQRNAEVADLSAAGLNESMELVVSQPARLRQFGPRNGRGYR